MKIPLLCFLVLSLFCSNICARVPQGRDVTTEPESYFSTNAQGVDSAAILPPPPLFGDVRFLYDRAAYEHGLSLRDTERGRQAARDADVRNLPELFSEAFGASITRENAAEIFALIQRVHHELGNMSTRTAKRTYKRLRPYVLYNAGTCLPAEEDRLRHSGSYPSGHSSRGWGIALILSEINPGRKEIILRQGYEIGQSRVICGYHWQSDVDAGRLAGAAGVANLHANADFLLQLKKARDEFERLVREGKAKTE